jgi:phosphoenolpyruvate carboxykinase (GTP)
MAMLPFCGYHMGDYFKHWLEIGRKMSRPPKIFYVNWFRRDKDGKFIWPGFSENLRIINWVLARCEGKVGAVETPLGYIPRYEDIDMAGLDFPKEKWDQLFRIDKASWKKEWEEQKKFFAKFGKKLPKGIKEEHKAFEQRLLRQ